MPRVVRLFGAGESPLESPRSARRGPAGAQRAHSGRAAGAWRADRPTDFGLLDVDCYCMNSGQGVERDAACNRTVNSKARWVDKSRFRVGCPRPISATSVGIVTA